ncbi:hypothetical protein HanHA89_Chr16g0641521 [Helianthus annuus]|nr:hypothetical protein HanHA89_Chr16g0641521 [Helianthus annuus]
MLSPINTNVFSPTICCKLLLAFHHRGECLRFEAWIQWVLGFALLHNVKKINSYAVSVLGILVQTVLLVSCE